VVDVAFREYFLSRLANLRHAAGVAHPELADDCLLLRLELCVYRTRK
jgi:hypothetical protein